MSVTIEDQLQLVVLGRNEFNWPLKSEPARYSFDVDSGRITIQIIFTSIRWLVLYQFFKIRLNCSTIVPASQGIFDWRIHFFARKTGAWLFHMSTCADGILSWSVYILECCILHSYTNILHLTELRGIRGASKFFTFNLCLALIISRVNLLLNCNLL